MLPEISPQTANKLICVQNCSYMLFSVVLFRRGKSDAQRYSATSSKTTCRCSLPLGFIGTAIPREPHFKRFASRDGTTELLALRPDQRLKSPQHKSHSPYQLSPGLAEQLLATKIDMQKKLHIFRRKERILISKASEEKASQLPCKVQYDPRDELVRLGPQQQHSLNITRLRTGSLLESRTAFLNYQLPYQGHRHSHLGSHQVFFGVYLIQAHNNTQLLLQPLPLANVLPTTARIYLATLQMGFASFACGVYPLPSNRRDYCILVGRKWHTENQRQLSTFGVQPQLGLTQMV